MFDILSLYPEELEARLTAWNQPRYRAAQLFSWLHKGVASFGEMSDLPRELRAKLEEEIPFPPLRLSRRQESADGTVKFLWELRDGEAVETVSLDYETGRSLCLSTQAGCRQGCAFCASATGGLKRNLTAGEILGQLLYGGPAASGLVLMGIGEPLDNFDETVRFLKLLSHPAGRAMSLRHVSLSTCGLVPEIRKLADMKTGLTLSVSLHAADDETRSQIMPANRRYGLHDLLSACKYFVTRTGRRISYEYVMIQGLNDSPEAARRLCALLRGHQAHVNLIKLNPVEGKPWRGSEPGHLREFAALLRQGGVNATLRRTLGADIDAACGQLRRKAAAKERTSRNAIKCAEDMNL